MRWLWRRREPVPFQIMSDLHLEVGRQYAGYYITARAPSLILAGNIGRLADYKPFRDFLHRLCRLYENVFLVLGNQEFYGLSYQEGMQLAAVLEEDPGFDGKLIILNRKQVMVEDVTLMGCTLHSYIPPEAEKVVQHNVGDFQHIVDWTVADRNSEHQKDVQFLSEQIGHVEMCRRYWRPKILVVTHHAPSMKGTSEPSDEANPWSAASATDLLSKENPMLTKAKYWVFGHTHYSTIFTRGKVKLISNQRGYVSANQDGNTSETPKNLKSKARGLFRRNKKQRPFNPDKIFRL